MSGARKHRLRANMALEDAGAEDPFDEERWSILEDWLLEVETDPRAAIILLEKAGQVDEATRAREELLAELLGTQHAALTESLFALRWRAGYLRECHFADVVGGSSLELFKQLCAAPAAALLRALVLTIHAGHIADVVPRLGRARFARSLRQLTLSSWDAPLVEAKLLADLPRLQRLELRGMFVKCAPEHPLAGVRSVTLAFTSYDRAALPQVLEATRFTSLDELVLDVRGLEGWMEELAASLAHTLLEPLLDGTVVSCLERFEVRGRLPVALVHPLLEVLSTSPLLPALSQLSLGDQLGEAELLRSRFGAAFDGIRTLMLPAGFVA